MTKMINLYLLSIFQLFQDDYWAKTVEFAFIFKKNIIYLLLFKTVPDSISPNKQCVIVQMLAAK